MMRVILYTGKGGVGKTTVAAATALRSARFGHRTIVLSTDSAHSLSDSFNFPLEATPRLITPNLWGQEPEMAHTVETHWGTIQKWMSSLLVWRGIEEIVADEMTILPGMEELAYLLYIVDYYRRDEYNVIVVDCAPTGEALRLLSFPEVLHWWMEKMFPIGRRAISLAQPLAKALMNIPMPDNAVLASIENLYSELDEIQALLSNQDISSVRLVVNPEKMVIKEAQRTFTYLNLYGYLIDLIICNRLIPDKVGDQYFSQWKESQSKYCGVIEESFAPLQVFTVPLLQREAIGIPMLEIVADALYQGNDPTQFFYHSQAQELSKENNCYVLTLSLPLAEKSNISLIRSGDELVVWVGDYKRNIVLPRILVGLTDHEAKFEDGKLKIKFRLPQEESPVSKIKSKGKH